LISGAWADVDKRGGLIELELVSEVRSIQPGQPFTVALHIQHAPKWHTYWRSPGLVGMPTTLDWALPEGFEAGPIQWPPPERVDMLDVNAHGYTGEVLLMVEITPPADLTPGTEVTLNAKSSWMTCSRSCHPGFGDFSLTLPVTDAAPEPNWDSVWHKRITAEMEKLPEPLQGFATAVTTDDEGVISLTIAPEEGQSIPPGAEVYCYSYAQTVDSDSVQEVTRQEDGAVTILMQPLQAGVDRPEEFAGLLYLSSGWPQNDGAKFAEFQAEW